MRHDLFDTWKPTAHILRPFRGWRGRFRYVDEDQQGTKILAGFNNKWFTGRVVGRGTHAGTYEVLFDKGQGADDSKDDRCPCTPPFLGKRDANGLSKGPAAMRRATGEITWDSVISD